jgi:hypothetical protein
MLFGPLHRSSPFMGELRCQAIQMEHGPYIAERTQKAEMYMTETHFDEEFFIFT